MKNKIKEGGETLLHIKWRDSRIYIEPAERDDDFSISEMQTVGFLIIEDDKQIVIARDVHDESDCRGIIVIPKENIIYKEKLYIATVSAINKLKE